MSLPFLYLDPGTGSVIIQAAIGAVAGIGIFGRKAINGARYKVADMLKPTGVKKSKQ